MLVDVRVSASALCSAAMGRKDLEASSSTVEET